MKKLLIGISTVLLLIFIFLVYSGLFSRIAVKEIELGPFVMAYEDHTGSYSDVGKVFQRQRDSLEKEFKIKPARYAGIYLDDPQSVPKEKLRSEIGFIIDDKDIGRLDDLKTRFKVRKLDRIKYASVLFPHRNPASIFIGVVRVYPRLGQYVKDRKYKTDYGLEIYDSARRQVTFAFALR